MTESIHPGTNDLYDYFSVKPGRLLNAREREAISDHLRLCIECGAIQNEIQEHDTNWNSISPLPENEEEKHLIIQSVEWVKKELVKFKKEELDSLSVFREKTGGIIETVIEIALGRQRVQGQFGSVLLSAGTSISEVKKKPDSVHSSITHYIRRDTKEVIFVANRDISSAQLLLQDVILYEERDWQAKQGKPIPAESLVKNPQASANKWEFKDGVLWRIYIKERS